MAVADTGFLLALADSGDRNHESCVAWLSEQTEPVQVPSSVIAGVAHTFDQMGRQDLEESFLRELGQGASLRPAEHTRSDYTRMSELVDTYGRAGFGTAEAGVVAVAERTGTTQIASTEPDLFRAVVPSGVDYFVLPPTDRFDASAERSNSPADTAQGPRTPATEGNAPDAVVDTGVLVSLANPNDSYHQASEDWLRGSAGQLVIPGPVVGEAGFQIRSMAGPEQEGLFLAELGKGTTFEVAAHASSDYTRAADLMSQHSDIKLGAVDASVVATAEGKGARSIATVDTRDFTKLKNAAGASWGLPIQEAQQRTRTKGKRSQRPDQYEPKNLKAGLAKAKGKKGNQRAQGSGSVPQGRANPFSARGPRLGGSGNGRGMK